MAIGSKIASSASICSWTLCSIARFVTRAKSFGILILATQRSRGTSPSKSSFSRMASVSRRTSGCSTSQVASSTISSGGTDRKWVAISLHAWVFNTPSTIASFTAHVSSVEIDIAGRVEVPSASSGISRFLP